MKVYINNDAGLFTPEDMCIHLLSGLECELMDRYGRLEGHRQFNQWLIGADIMEYGSDDYLLPIRYLIPNYLRSFDEIDRVQIAYELQDELIDAISEALPDNQYLDWVEDWPGMLGIYSYSE